VTTPAHCLEVEVPPDWVDYNGHMNDACYAIAFSRGGDAFMATMGLTQRTREETHRTIYTLALVIRFVAEAKLGERIAITLQLLERDEKRLKFWMEARRVGDNALLATSEQVLMCVDQGGERPHAAAFPPEVEARLEATARAHAELPAPAEAGQGLTLRRRTPSSVTP
jgi:acyl-CoA thioester hydrolase